MKIKTYYAKTMAEALRLVKAELGADALLLSTKEIASRSGANGSAAGFEVVAACDDSTGDELVLGGLRQVPDAKATCTQPSGASRVHPAGGEIDRCTYTPATLMGKSRADSKTRTAPKKTAAKRVHSCSESEPQVAEKYAPPQSGLSHEIYQELIASGVEDWLASRLIQEAQDTGVPRQRRSRAALSQRISEAAQRMILAPPSEGAFPFKRVVVFVGPTGVGKTTSIAKLAARLALREKKKVALLTLDGFRIGAVEQLKTYAGIIGIPFRFVSQATDLRMAIQEFDQRDYVLIDTTGRSPRDLGTLQELAEVLRASEDLERHLVLSATTRPSDLPDIIKRFEICKPDQLLFTKLDETSALGPILNELVRSGKPMSYYSNGQNVPQDFHMVSREQIVDMVLNRN